MVKKAAQATPNQLLRRARLERGWTQKVVAERIGAPNDMMVTRWERGTAFPSAYISSSSAGRRSRRSEKLSRRHPVGGSGACSQRYAFLAKPLGTWSPTTRRCMGWRT